MAFADASNSVGDDIMNLNIEQILQPHILQPQHIQDLAESRISREAAEAPGIASIPPRWGDKILGLCGSGWATGAKVV
jgi:hypothetical protein